MNTVESTVKLPAWSIVPCTNCGQLHSQDTQHIILEYIGKIAYDACRESCEQIILDRIGHRLGSSLRIRPMQFQLVQLTTNLQEQINDLKQLIREWQALVNDAQLPVSVVKHRVWVASYAELKERTQKVLQKEVK